jgi:predicted hotdog family 3-hydroxylacyl-ACP dehydratase
MTPCRYPVSALLPHKPPMILLDEVLEYDENALRACVTISESSMFVEPSGVASYIGLEYMAQACGAYAGTLARESGAPVRVGFLLGTRHYKAHIPWFRVGDRLLVSVAVTFNDGEMGSFDCRIHVNGAIAAEAQLNVFQPQSDHAILRGAVTGD